jgi:hypothetical protein
MGGKEVGEEEEFQYGKDDKQLNKDDSPQRFAKRHVAKAICIQVIGSIKYVLFFHREGA